MVVQCRWFVFELPEKDISNVAVQCRQYSTISCRGLSELLKKYISNVEVQRDCTYNHFHKTNKTPERVRFVVHYKQNGRQQITHALHIALCKKQRETLKASLPSISKLTLFILDSFISSVWSSKAKKTSPISRQSKKRHFYAEHVLQQYVQLSELVGYT